MTTTAVTIGKFDGFHKGHRLLLEKLNNYAEAGGKDIETVCIRLEMGGAGILTPDEQERIIKECGIGRIERIYFSPEFASLTPDEFVKMILKERLNASYVAVGEDFRFGRNRSGDVDVLAQLGIKYGIRVEAVPKLIFEASPVSSTRIRALLEDGCVDKASELLGADYGICGIVTEGKRLGRTLGFPTINLIPGEEKLLPRYGVYASETFIEGAGGEDRSFKSITNIGIRPSVDDGDLPNAETFILNDFHEDIYGGRVAVRLKSFIREERRFESLDELQSQIAEDIEIAKHQ